MTNYLFLQVDDIFMNFRKIASIKTSWEFLEYTASLGIELPFDELVESGNSSILSQPMEVGGMTIGNRFTVLPMEGWDGTYPVRLPS
jgi:NADPH2 dehydrogenase